MNSFELVKGVIDMHCHGYPEISFKLQNARDDDDDMIRQCIDMGMRGIVLKSNVFSGIRECYYMQKLFPDFLIVPSLTMNTVCGGLDPLAVEMAMQMGVKVVHMPTWSSWNDIRTNNFSPRIRPFCKHADRLTEASGLRALNDDGTLKTEVKQIVDVIKENDGVLFTGHFHKDESKKLIEYAHEIGFKKLVWCHPMVMDVTPEEMEWAISMGAYIEFIYITMLPAYQLEKPADIAALINRLGAEHVVLSSDHYDEYSPSTAEMNRLWIATLQNYGITDDQIRTMMIETPAKLLNLPPWEEVLAEREKAESCCQK